MSFEQVDLSQPTPSLGTDPEFFIFDKGKLVSAFKFLPPKGDGVSIYWDGFQAEYKLDGAWTCQNNLVKFNRERLIQLEAAAKAKFPTAHVSLRNVIKLTEEARYTAKPEHIALGCDPSENAYGLRPKPIDDPRELKYRFAGGHMHFGGFMGQRPNYVKFAQTLDATVGIWSVGVAQNQDNPVRRKYYGLPGEYRKPEYGLQTVVLAGNVQTHTNYGIEYRTLSNFWFASPAICQVTWDIARLGFKLAYNNYQNLWIADPKEVIETIVNNDVKQANIILERNKAMLEWMLGQRYATKKACMHAIRIAKVGLEEYVGNPNDIATNWHFKDAWLADAKQPWARWATSLAEM